MPSFSLKWMLASVAAVALGCVALLNASPAWAAATYAVALLLLLTAPVCIAYRQGERRAFWAGFAVFGWAYLAVLALDFQETPAGRLPTAVVIQAASEPIYQNAREEWTRKLEESWVQQGKAAVLQRARNAHRITFLQSRSGTFPEGLTDVHMQTWEESVESLQYLRRNTRPVGHSLFTIIRAFIGGAVGRFVFATRDKGES